MWFFLLFNVYDYITMKSYISVIRWFKTSLAVYFIRLHVCIELKVTQRLKYALRHQTF